MERSEKGPRTGVSEEMKTLTGVIRRKGRIRGRTGAKHRVSVRFPLSTALASRAEWLNSCSTPSVHTSTDL